MYKMNLVIKPRQVMNHFCWNYANVLYQKAMKLVEEDRLFINGNEEARSQEKRSSFGSELTQIGIAVMDELLKQIHCKLEGLSGESVHPSFIEDSLQTCQEFLEIFKSQDSTQEIEAEKFSNWGKPEPKSIRLTPILPSQDDDVPF